jgi:hypothetical protein
MNWRNPEAAVGVGNRLEGFFGSPSLRDFSGIIAARRFDSQYFLIVFGRSAKIFLTTLCSPVYGIKSNGMNFSVQIIDFDQSFPGTII